jgi:hypothetical protein
MLYRQVLQEMISRVEAGEDPLGVFRQPEEDVQIDILVEAMVPPRTPTSVRGMGRVNLFGDSGNRISEAELDPEVVAKQMRSGQNSISPVLDQWVEMRMDHLALRRLELSRTTAGG